MAGSSPSGSARWTRTWRSCSLPVGGCAKRTRTVSTPSRSVAASSSRSVPATSTPRSRTPWSRKWGAPTWPPNPPNARSTPAKPWRSSILRKASRGLRARGSVHVAHPARDGARAGREEHNRGRHVLHPLYAAAREPLPVGKREARWPKHGAGRHAVDGDAQRPERRREPARQRGGSRLRERVGDVARPRLQRADVADVHDMPPVAPHHASGGLRAKEGAPQVEVEVAVVLRRGGVEERRALEDGGVVDEDVEPAEAPGGVAHESSGRPGVGEVGAESEGARARGLELADRPARRTRRAVVADRHVHAGPRQGERDRPSDAHRASRDERPRAMWCYPRVRHVVPREELVQGPLHRGLLLHGPRLPHRMASLDLLEPHRRRVLPD